MHLTRLSFTRLSIGLLAALSVTACLAAEPEATIRKNLAERFKNFPTINEVTPAPVPGLYEVRLNDTDLIYTDAKGDFVIQGNIIDAKTRRNLTEERTEKLLAIDFDKLPLKDAFTIVRGKGERKVAVFEDPNCGYCKRFERDLQKVDNITIYMFLYPILGPDSVVKSKTIWCAKDKGKAFLDWMVRDVPLSGEGKCNTDALARNTAFGQKNKINGTPTTIFTDGSRVSGAINTEQIERFLAAAK
jgi:thiol:disulfide interchange protein DsbC